METAQQKENIKAGTEVSTVDLLKMVGSLAKDQLLRVRVPALTFSFSRSVRSYWNAFWGGHHLPLRLRIDGDVDKEIFVGRLAFAVTYIVADSIYLVGSFGIWLLRKLPWKINVINVLVVAGLVVGFLGWVFPWWLEEMNFMDGIKETKTMQVLRDIDLTIPQIPSLPLGWLVVPVMIGGLIALPFSVARLKRWRGLRSILKKKTKPIIEDEASD